jgi:hypothetical protein
MNASWLEQPTADLKIVVKKSDNCFLNGALLTV